MVDSVKWKFPVILHLNFEDDFENGGNFINDEK